MPEVTRYVFTTNNYTPADETHVRSAAADVRYLVFGFETGESGTPHLQGFVIFNHSKTLGQAKRAIGPRAHLERARGSNLDASNYCKKGIQSHEEWVALKEKGPNFGKEAVFEEFGSFPPEPNKTHRFDAFKEWVLAHPHKPRRDEVATEFPSIFLQYGRCMEWIDLIYPAPQPPTGVELRSYQRRLEERLEQEPDDRKIIFVIDPVGNTGKSFFGKYMYRKHPDDVQILSIAKRDDLCHTVNEHKSIFIFDVPRSQSEFLQYSVLESLKDGLVFSPKYQSRMKMLTKKAHVVVMMNERPDMNKLSTDRYEVINWLSL